MACSHTVRSAGCAKSPSASRSARVPRDIRGLVLGHGLRLFGVGIGVGALAVAASAGVIRSFLFGVSPLDAQTYLIVGLILSVVTILAAWLPARRACRVNPIVALRAE